MYERGYLILFSVFFVVLLAFVLYRSSKDKFSLLRDAFDPASPCTDPLNNPFSLSKVQAFIWTFIILGAVAFVWSVTGYFPEIKTSHLVLMGIAGGQRLLGQVIDETQKPAKFQAVAAAAAIVGTAKAVPAGCSKDFFTDLISDKDGISVIRMQYLVITFIFLVMFITKVMHHFQLMDFTTEQLALMGVSAGLYVWNKKLNQ